MWLKFVGQSYTSSKDKVLKKSAIPLNEIQGTARNIKFSISLFRQATIGWLHQ
jgi:hypothetical protein